MSTYYQGNPPGPGAGGGSTFYNQSAYGQQQQPQQQQQQQQYQPYGAPNVQQWQQPSYNSQNQQQQQQQRPHGGNQFQQQQQQQQQQQTPVQPFWNPNTAATVAGIAAQAASGNFSNDAVLDWVAKGGQSVWKSSSASMVPGLETAMRALRTYFAVDNRYVKRKMQKILVPFRATHWTRMQTDSGTEPIEYALPINDENAPDLYLPSMCLITYVLLCAIGRGTAGEFNPDVISNVTTMCFVTQIIEVLLIRLGFYMMQAPVPFLDLFSYTGYKYLGLCVNILFGMITGQIGYGTYGFYVAFLWTASAASFFMLKTMANNVPTVTASTGPKRDVMVLVFAASQFLSMWFVSQTKFL